MLRCTTCEVPLSARHHEGAHLHACPGCGGVFIAHRDLVMAACDEVLARPDGERKAAAAQATGRMHADPASPPRRCSACARGMRRYVYGFSSGVVVDGCGDHGLWLDAGELERIEAWSEAARRGLTRPVDAAAVRSAPEPGRASTRRSQGPAGDPIDRGLVAAARLGNGDAAMLAMARRVAWHVRQQADAARRTTDGASGAMLAARAQAEADAVPTEDAGAVVVRASVPLACGAAVAWPHLAQPHRYPGWMAGLVAVEVVSGAGSTRVQQLSFGSRHAVRQRVTRFVPDRHLTWRDEDEWLQGLAVPAWHGGAWTELTLEGGRDRCSAGLTVTHLPLAHVGRSVLEERAPALQAWADASLAALAAAISPPPPA